MVGGVRVVSAATPGGKKKEKEIEKKRGLTKDKVVDKEKRGVDEK